MRFVWDWDRCEFQQLKGLDHEVSTATLHQQKGVSLQDQFIRRFVYGNNEIRIPLKSIPELLFLEILNPFYVFQFCSFILWFLDNYYSYAIAILAMSSFGIAMSIIQTRRVSFHAFLYHSVPYCIVFFVIFMGFVSSELFF